MIFAAILAGGVGTRMGLNEPKQFIPVGDKPILIHTMDKFLEVDEIDRIIVSSPESFIKTTEKLIDKYYGDNSGIVVIEGGLKRNDTILNSIKYIKENFNEDNHVLVTHDASRIFASSKLIRNTIIEVRDCDAVSPVIPAVDVIFESKNKRKLDNIPPRENLLHSQTPQTFKINRFIEIYNSLSEDEINMLNEAIQLFYLRNANIKLIEGEFNNFKITYSSDLKIAETFLNTDRKI